MAKRVTNAGVQVEHVATTNYKRVTNAGVMVEHKDTTNFRRITAVGIMVEWAPGGPAAVERVQVVMVG